jgi:Guanylate kinase
MILLVGASASGKTEIAKYLRAKYGIVKAITHTSRAPRLGEKDGVDYFFVDEATFLALKAENKFVETTYYNGHYYGCSKSQVNDDKCVVVDPNGLKNFLALKDPRLITFYLKAPASVREQRMQGRGDDPKLIAERLANDKTAFGKGKIEATDFVIQTGSRTIEEIGDDIYKKYMAALAKRS